MVDRNHSLQKQLETDFLKRIETGALDRELKHIAQRLKDEAIAEIETNGGNCPENQNIIRSLQIVKGSEPGQYFVVSRGEYGKNREFGTKDTLESPWFIPAFAKVSGSIRNCLQGALHGALLRTRRHHVR